MLDRKGLLAYLDPLDRLAQQDQLGQPDQEVK